MGYIRDVISQKYYIYTIDKSPLRISIILLFVTAFISGPTFSVGPADLGLFDVVFVILSFSTLSAVLNYSKFKITDVYLIHLAMLFILFSLYLPILGYMIYNYPFSYIIGDFRWGQVVLFSFSIILYTQSSRDRLRHILFISLKTLVILNILFLIIQLIHSSGLPIPDIVNIWYPGGIEDYYHIGRYSGATGNISTLGLVGCLGIVVFSYSYLFSATNGFYLLVSIVLLVGASSRTSVIASMVAVMMISLIKIRKLGINQKNISRNLIILISVFVPVYYFNIGRIRTQSERYLEIFSFVFGERTWQEASGRGDVWQNALRIVSEEYTMGTLANPAWVLQDVTSITTVDSAYVLLYLQGDWLFLGIYIVLLFTISLYSIKIVLNESLGAISLGLVIVILVHSVTQNFVTGIPGKTVILFTISLYMCISINSSS